MLKIEPRKEPSRVMLYATPFLAVLFTIVAGFILFSLLDKNPATATYLIFISPLTSLYTITELLVKATPLILIAIGLAVGFRAGVWNIGAEGQFTMGALAGGAMALALYEVEGLWVLPLVCLAGALGGMAWAAIPAFLRTRLNTNEILVSLMLVYVATLLLGMLVHGPLRDPDGFNFPESRLFHDAATLPALVAGTRAHVGFLVAIIAVIVAWILLRSHMIGFQIKVVGQAPRAARFAGFSSPRIVWFCFMISGALAGLAGIFEATGPVGQLVPALPVGYGFTAIIVAFLGRLHPLGILAGGLLLALTYIGGEAAQISMSLPSATVQVFQGMLLFFLLATDILVNYRVSWIASGRRPAKTALQQPAE
ncbi:MAG: ABC transporter permease [Hyphomicrobiales bacterium]|nr:ABC transporter permease [Hyphomicrobiales bacterium]